MDMGGASLIRGAANNHDSATVLTDPADYPEFLAELAAQDGATTLALRRRLAGAAYARTAAYDAVIASWMAEQRGETFPATLTVGATRRQLLRYGENPHQEAALYVADAGKRGVATGATVVEAYAKALACDPVSAFGGIVAVNRTLDAASAAAMAKLFLEVIIAPEASEEASAALAGKSALRLLITGGMPDATAPGVNLRSLAGGYLLQTRD